MLSKLFEYIRSITEFEPEIAIVLGSGLSDLKDSVDIEVTVPNSDMDAFPTSTAPNHNGDLIFGYLEGKKVAVLDGRVHLYEGYTPNQIVTPLRLLRKLGCSKIILTNAAGGINKNFNVGDLMLITDHISSFVNSPLIGANNDTLGVRFPDMSQVYSKRINEIVFNEAAKADIKLQKGVYVQLTGPQFETPAEIKMLSALGADAVGMSTVIEAIAAKHCGYEVCGLSLITNLACGILDTPISEEEVVETANKTKEKFKTVITNTVKEI